MQYSVSNIIKRFCFKSRTCKLYKRLAKPYKNALLLELMTFLASFLKTALQFLQFYSFISIILLKFVSPFGMSTYLSSHEKCNKSFIGIDLRALCNDKHIVICTDFQKAIEKITVLKSPFPKHIPALKLVL